jgi:hypothetical protein
MKLGFYSSTEVFHDISIPRNSSILTKCSLIGIRTYFIGITDNIFQLMADNN